MKILVIYFLFLNFQLFDNFKYDCDSKHYFSNENVFVFKEFKNIENINFSCINNMTTNVKIFPLEPIILEKNNEIILNEKYHTNFITFVNLKGIEITARNLLVLENPHSSYFVYIRRSLFNFYSNSNLITESDCSSQKNLENFHSLFSMNRFSLSLLNVNFNQKACNLYFKNSKISLLFIDSLANSSLYRNYLRFLNMDQNLSVNLNSTISNIAIECYRIVFNSELFNEYVFKRMESIDFQGTILDIKVELFCYFESLKYINFYLNNLSEFVHKTWQWAYLKNCENLILNSSKFKTVISFANSINFLLSSYSFPEEDFCLFDEYLENFLIKVDVRILLKAKNLKNLSCTIVNILNNYRSKDLSFYEFYSNNKSIMEEFETRCQLKKLCLNSMKYANEISNQLLNDLDFEYLSKYFQYIFEVILNPSLCIMGFCSNILLIVILKLKQYEKDFKKKMFKYLLINSCFNCFNLLFDIFHPINVCIEFHGVFCSKIRDTVFAQYYFIASNFLNGYFNFCANVTLILLSLERLEFDNIDSKNRKFLKFIDKRLFRLLLPIALLFNFNKLFEFKIYYNHESLTDDYPGRLQYGDFGNKFLKEFFSYSIMITSFCNSFLFYFISLIIDLNLFFKYRNFMKMKKKILSSNEASSSNDHKILKMIIWFGIINFVLRTPELILSSINIYLQYNINDNIFSEKYLLNESSNLQIFCNLNKFCQEVLKSTQVLYKVSYFLNLFLFIHFNTVLKNNFKNIFKSCFHRTK